MNCYTTVKNKVIALYVLIWGDLKYIISVLEENIGRKISDIPLSNIFTDMSPRARDVKERINK